MTAWETFNEGSTSADGMAVISSKGEVFILQAVYFVPKHEGRLIEAGAKKKPQQKLRF